MTSHQQLLACVIRQYGTGLYRAWASLDRNSAICLSTSQDEASATEMVNRFLAMSQAGQIKNHEDILAFINAGGEPNLTESPAELAA